MQYRAFMFSHIEEVNPYRWSFIGLQAIWPQRASLLNSKTINGCFQRSVIGEAGTAWQRYCKR